MLPYWNLQPNEHGVDSSWSAPALLAWALVLLGILFPVLWVIPAFMPFCFGRSLWVRRAALTAALSACCYLLLAVIILPATLVTRSRGMGHWCGYYGYCG